MNKRQKTKRQLSAEQTQVNIKNTVIDIMQMYLTSISDENFQYIRHICMAHITCYTDYLFSREKMMYKVLSSAISQAQEQRMMKSDLNKEETYEKNDDSDRFCGDCYPGRDRSAVICRRDRYSGK